MKARIKNMEPYTTFPDRPDAAYTIYIGASDAVWIRIELYFLDEILVNESKT